MIKPIFKNKFKIPEWAREIVFSLFVFSLTLLSSSVPFAFGTYPFALSICASSKKQAPFAFFGALFGTIFFLDSSPVYLIGYLALFVLRLLASFFKKPKEKPLLGKRNVSFLDELFYESAILRVLSAFSVALGIGLFYMIVNGYLLFYICSLLFFSVTVPVLTFLLIGLWEEQRRGRSFLIALATLIFIFAYSLSGREIGGVDFSMVLSFMLVIYISKTTSTLYAVCLGLVLGLVGSGALAPILGIMALVSGLLWRISYYIAIMCGFVASLGYGIFVGGYEAIVNFAPEALFASLVMYPALRFELLPVPSFLSEAKSSAGSARALDTEIQNMKLKSHTEEICRALIDIADVFKGAAKSTREKSKDSVYKMCNEITREHCYLCPKKQICHEKDTSLTKTSVTALSEGVYYLGEAKKESLDEKFVHRCPNIENIISKINETSKNELKSGIKNDRLSLGASCFDLTAKLLASSALSLDSSEESVHLSALATKCALTNGLIFDKLGVFGEKRRRILIVGVDITRSKISEGDLGRALEDALDISLDEPSVTYDESLATIEINELPPHKTSVFSLSVARENEINGDSLISFKSRLDKEYFIICDGMGSGKDAAITSKMCTDFLKEVLSCSLDKESALSLLNSFVRAKGHECSSSVDLLEIDPFNGEAVFFKSGATSSYIKRDGTVFKLSSKTAPVGILKRLDSERTFFNLSSGDFCVMVSDGALDKKGEDKELCALIKAFDKEKSEELCRGILDLAKSRGARDDISVMVIKFE